MTRRVLLIALSIAAALSLVALELPYRYRRDLPVAAPGWLQFQMPLEVLARLGASGDDFLLADPAGAPLPLFPWRGPQDPPPSRRGADLKDMKTVPGGWLLEADLGPGDFRHRMLLLDLPGIGLAETVTLEGSSDGQRWETLARGSMFRLSRWGLTEKTYLEYPPTKDRHLRIFWPESAGFPRWKALEVADWPDDRAEWSTEPVAFEPAWEAGGEKAYALHLPKTPVERATLLVAVSLAYPVRARLLAARSGCWSQVAETVLLPDRSPLVSLPESAFGDPVCLALSGGSYGAPAPTGFRLRYAPRAFVFKATQTGTYVLHYGALGRTSPSAALHELPVMPDSCGVATLSSERVQPLPDLPAPSLAMGAALPDTKFIKRYSVVAGETSPGSLVRLKVPEDLYEAAQSDLGDVRIGSQGRQVPYVLYSPAEGVEVLSLKGAVPKPAQQPGESELLLDLPCEELPLVALELSAPSAPFSRSVTLEFYQAAPPAGGVGDARWVTLDRATWVCPGVGDTPARLTLRPGRAGSRKLRIAFQDGDNAPLPSVDAALWRQGHVLIFPWPEKGPVELLAGAKGIRAPQYDLAALSEDIIHRPAAEARVQEQPVHAAVGEASPAWRWALLLGLLVAAGILILVLSRSLKRAPGGEEKP